MFTHSMCNPFAYVGPSMRSDSIDIGILPAILSVTRRICVAGNLLELQLGAVKGSNLRVHEAVFGHISVRPFVGF